MREHRQHRIKSQNANRHVHHTGPHRFYSDTRHDWVAAKDIHDNEVIRGRPGPLAITAKRQLPGTQRIYNLTVEGEHVYYVSHLGLLAPGATAGLSSSAVLLPSSRGHTDLVVRGSPSPAHRPDRRSTFRVPTRYRNLPQRGTGV